MRLITSSTLSNQNISAALLCHTYPADAVRALVIRLFVDQIVGNGDYTVHATCQRGGAGTAYPTVRTVETVPSGDTAHWFNTISFAVSNGDIIKIYLKGLITDIATPDIITEIWEDDSLRPNVAGQYYVDVDAAGGVEVGAMQAAALAQFFTVNTGQTGAGAVVGSVIHEIGHAVLAIGTVFPAGAIDFTYTLTDSVTLLPIQGADVWFSTDAGGLNIVWKGVTDAFGVARDVNNNLPWLDAGTYRVWAQRVGYAPSSFPDVEVAS